VRPELYDAVEEATRDDFDLVAELGGGAAWAAFLGRPVRGRGRLAVLLLQEADDESGQYDLETIEALDAGLPIGRTTCVSCGASEPGWPRFCAVCRTDLSGEVVPGGSAEETLEEVRGAARGVYDVLGEMPRDDGGGALYFAREVATDRLVGLTLQNDALGELDLVVSWVPVTEGEADVVVEQGPETSRAPADLVDPSAAADDHFEAASFRADAGASRSRDRRRRMVGIAAVALIALSLLAGIALVGRAYLVRGDAVASVTAPFPDPPAAAEPAVPEVEEPRSASPDVRDRPPTPQPPAMARPTAPAPGPAAEPPPVSPTTGVERLAAAPSAGGIADAVARYASAVQSRQTSRISAAYPGITAAEVERWERFFRPLGTESGLQTRHEIVSGPSVQGTRGEVVFTLTLSYADASGRPVELPLPLRAVLEWTGREWSLREVRSLQ
jgi:hypothetical protein